MQSAAPANQSSVFSFIDENNQKMIVRFNMLAKDDLYSPLEPSDFTYYQDNAEKFCKLVGAKRAGEIVFAAFSHHFENIAVALIEAGADVNTIVESCSNSMLKSAEINGFEKAVAAIKQRESAESKESLESTVSQVMRAGL